MELIVVKENQTVRGVEMSHEQFIINHIKVIVIVFGLFFMYNTAFGKTISMEVDGKEVITITVSEDENAQKTEETEEEPDCE